LNNDARIQYTKIAKIINRTEGTVRNRIQRLQRLGIIQGYQVVTEPINLGFEEHSIIKFQMNSSYETFTSIENLPRVGKRLNCQLLNLYRCNGNNSFLLEVLGKNNKAMEKFVKELKTYEGIQIIEMISKKEKIYEYSSQMNTLG
jgi:DNA-binding Lrp family transcriptional regulator